jgi:predicted RNase H-like HicB family nuclease
MEIRCRESILVTGCSKNPMTKYQIIIYWSPADGAYVTEVPELPGCAAGGKTHKEALGNVELIVKEWIETAQKLGRPIPAPCGRLALACTAIRAPLDHVYH